MRRIVSGNHNDRWKEQSRSALADGAPPVDLGALVVVNADAMHDCRRCGPGTCFAPRVPAPTIRQLIVMQSSSGGAQRTCRQLHSRWLAAGNFLRSGAVLFTVVTAAKAAITVHIGVASMLRKARSAGALLVTWPMVPTCCRSAAGAEEWRNTYPEKRASPALGAGLADRVDRRSLQPSGLCHGHYRSTEISIGKAALILQGRIPGDLKLTVIAQIRRPVVRGVR